MSPYKDFEPGELLAWQEMSRILRELKEHISIISAQHSDVKTRLDDLEETVGDMMPVNWRLPWPVKEQ